MNGIYTIRQIFCLSKTVLVTSKCVTLRFLCIGKAACGFKVTFNDLKNKNNIFITEMRSKDDDIKLGYAVCLIDNEFSKDTSCIPRIYEIHLKSVNKSLITEMEIKNISFKGGNFQKDYSINRNIDVSINNNDEFILFIYHFSDTYKDTKNKALFSLCRKMKFKIQIRTSLNKVFEENISVDKHFIEKGFKEYPEGNIELMILVLRGSK